MLDQREDAVQIHRDGAMPLFIGHAIDGRILRRPDAVIRDQNVETPESRDRRRYQLPRRFRGRKIALQRATVFRATFMHQILGLRFRRLIIEDNFRARGHKHPHRRRANPARSAGDKSNFRIESQIHRAYKYRTPKDCLRFGHLVSRRLFVAQAFDGIELGGADGGDGSEQDADQRGDNDGDDGGEAGNGDAILGEVADGEGDGESDDDAEDAADEGDEDGLGEKLEADLAVGGAHRFADANLANAGADGGEHDVHDADATDQQHDERYREQDHGHGGRCLVGNRYELGQIPDAINGFRPMAGLNHALNLGGDWNHQRRIGRREENLLHRGRFLEIADHGVGNQHGVVGHLGLSEGVHALAEGPDDGERQSAQLQRLAERSLLGTVELDRQFRSYNADFVVGLRILLVEETSRENDNVTNLLVFWVHAHDLQVSLLASADCHTFAKGDDWRGVGNAADLVLDRFHIVDGQSVTAGVGDTFPTALVFRVDPVRADGLNLVQEVLLAGKTDGGNQNQGGGPDHHAERGQGESNLVAHEGLVGEAKDLAECEVGASVRDRCGIHLLVRCYGELVAAASTCLRALGCVDPGFTRQVSSSVS